MIITNEDITDLTGTSLTSPTSTYLSGLFNICHNIFGGGKPAAVSVRYFDQVIPRSYGFFVLRGGVRIYPDNDCSISEESILEITSNDPRGLFSRQFRQEQSPYETRQTVYASQLGGDISGQTIVAGLVCNGGNRINSDENDTCYRFLSMLKRFYESFSTSGTIAEMLKRPDHWQFVISRESNEIIYTGEPLPEKTHDVSSSESGHTALNLVNTILTADNSDEAISQIEGRIENLKMADFRLVDSDFLLISFRLKPTVENQPETDNLIGGFTHKIKNRLGALQTAISQLSLQGGEIIGDDDLNLLEIIESTSESITDIVERYGLYQTISRKNNKPINLVSAVSHLITEYRHNTGVRTDIRLGCRDSAVFINGDQEQISLAITELLHNAALSGGACGPVWLKIEKASNKVKLTVENSLEPGDRLRKLTADSLLEPFISTRKNAAGLGLPIARKIVNNHDGEMIIDTSCPTCFAVNITFPDIEVHDARRNG